MLPSETFGTQNGGCGLASGEHSMQSEGSSKQSGEGSSALVQGEGSTNSAQMSDDHDRRTTTSLRRAAIEPRWAAMPLQIVGSRWSPEGLAACAGVATCSL